MNVTPLFASRPAGPGCVVAPAAGTRPSLDAVFARDGQAITAALDGRGALLFRGFAVTDAAGFASAMRALGLKPFGYVGGDAPRTALHDGVFTSTEYPASEAISLHHEMSYLPQWPRRIAFFADRASAANGQTSLAMTREVTEAIPDEVKAKFADRGLLYVRNFRHGVPLGRSWQETFATTDRGAVAGIAAARGSRCSWSTDGSLRVETPREAFLADDAGEPLWFNQAEQWHPSALAPSVRAKFETMLGPEFMPHDCRHRDGSPLAPDDLAAIRRAMAGAKLLFDWCDKDVLLLDNRAIMHGREPFAGPRRILAYLAAP